MRKVESRAKMIASFGTGLASMFSLTQFYLCSVTSSFLCQSFLSSFALENWLIKLPLGDQNKLLGWGRMVMDGMEEIMGKGVTTLCSGPQPEAKVSKIRVTSHILWLGFWEPPRNFGTMKTNMFHFTVTYVSNMQLCRKKKTFKYSRKEKPS